MLQELLAVVGQEDERRPVAQRAVEPVPEPPDEQVAVADVVVVERPQVLDVARLERRVEGEVVVALVAAKRPV